MKKQIFIFLFFLTFKICNAQNLVPNGNFEQYSGCPTYLSFSDSLLFWISPTSGTPDYYNGCSTSPSIGVPYNYFGFQPALSDSGYIGICLWCPNNVREYIEVPLVSTLVANFCYHFEMYLNLGDISRFTTESVGAYFSDTAIIGINNWDPLPFVSQINNITGNVFDTVNWTLVSGDYTAQGGENYLIIGNFNNDANTTTILVNNASIYNYAYCYIEDVSLVYPCDLGIDTYKRTNIKTYPNPFSETLTVAVNNHELTELSLYDIQGRRLMKQTFAKTITLNTEGIEKGIYLYEVRNQHGVIKTGKVIK
jgi:OmpA-OmpF porin, OOP family